MRNGDRITGEIKQLQQGKLKLKTSALDTVYIEWNKILELASTYEFEFEDTSGARRFGRIAGVTDGSITVVDEDGAEHTLLLADVVEIMPIDKSFWTRLDGSISVGFNYNKGSDVGQLLSDASLEYRTRTTRTGFDLSTSITWDSDEEHTSRDILSLDHQRYRDRWFSWLLGSLERNEALGLDLRTTLAGGGGHDLVSTDASQLSLGAGLALSEEESAGSSSGSASIEGVLWVRYSIFRFSEREVDSDFDLFVYPGITESGRVRSELNANVRREIFTNFFLELSGYYSYDNEPPQGAEQEDYGINTGLGWSF